jgi:hypothetical protein
MAKCWKAYTSSSASSSTNAEDLTLDWFGGLPRPRVGAGPRAVEALDLDEAADFLGGMTTRNFKKADG